MHGILPPLPSFSSRYRVYLGTVTNLPLFLSAWRYGPIGAELSCAGFTDVNFRNTVGLIGDTHTHTFASSGLEAHDPSIRTVEPPLLSVEGLLPTTCPNRTVWAVQTMAATRQHNIQRRLNNRDSTDIVLLIGITYQHMSLAGA